MPVNHRGKPGGGENITCSTINNTSAFYPRTSLAPQQVRRRGFSLIEVLIATAILMGSAVVLTRLAGMGRDQLNKAQLHAQAQQLCENTLNEILLGLRPMQNVPVSPLESDWQYRVTMVPVPAYSGLTSLSVHVWQSDDPVEQRDTASGASSPKRVRFSLTRWIRTPSGRRPNAAEPAASLLNEGSSGGEVP